MTTFVNLRKAAAQRFTDPSFAVVADAASANIRNWQDYVNNAYQEVLRATVLWPWNEATEQTVTVLANTRGIALPTDVLAVNSVYDVTNDRYINPDEGRASQYRGGRQLRSTTTQLADTFKMRGGNIELWPMVTVATQLALECVTYPAPMAADSDTPVFPVVFHNILVDGALALAYLDDGAEQTYTALWTKFMQAVDGMKIDVLQFRDQNYPPIRDTFWS